MQFKKDNMLSNKEVGVMNIARDKYINAFKKRAVNPSDFDANIACLEDLAHACNYWMAVATPHMEKELHAEKKAEESHFSFFKDKAREEALKEMLIIDSAKKLMLDGVETIIKEEFAKEPRIISLDYHENHKTTENKKGKVISRTNKDVYTITFSDKSTLILQDLDPESLAQAKIQFNEKMDELAPKSNTPSFS